MTRINSAIPVENLTDEHLLVEQKELKRMPHYLQRYFEKDMMKRMPKKFVLGRDHVIFFCDKMKFIFNRCLCIGAELKRRGLEVEEFASGFRYLQNTEYWNDYQPTDEERAILIEKITSRIMESVKKEFHYYGKPITKEEAIKLLQRDEH